MKNPLRYTLTALLGLAAVTALSAAPDEKLSRVEVTFGDVEKFTDAADGQRGSDFRREENLDEIKDYIVRRASSYVPEGQKLSVTITDVDLAGEVEPWRTGRAQDVRIVKDIYIPRIDLEFRLTDASGAVIKEGKRTLKDLAFNMKLRINNSDPRIYEKGLIDDWLRSEFKANKR